LAGVTLSESVKVRHSPLASENLTVTWERCKMGDKLVLITNRKSYMSFRLVLKSVRHIRDLKHRPTAPMIYLPLGLDSRPPVPNFYRRGKILCCFSPNFGFVPDCHLIQFAMLCSSSILVRDWDRPTGGWWFTVQISRCQTLQWGHLT